MAKRNAMRNPYLSSGKSGGLRKSPAASRHTVARHRPARTRRGPTRADHVPDKVELRRRRRRVAIVAGALAIVLVVFLVASNAYTSSVNQKLHDGLRSGVSGSLTGSADVTKPFYMLFLGKDDAQKASEVRTETVILARVDPARKLVTLVSIPHDTYVDLGGTYGSRSLDTAYALGGPELTIQAVSKIAGVGISHYAETDFAGFQSIVDDLEGSRST